MKFQQKRNIEKCIITEDVVLHHKQPEYIYIIIIDNQYKRIRQKKTKKHLSEKRNSDSVILLFFVLK